MKLRSAPLLGCFVLLFSLADVHFDCRDLAGSGLLDGIWLAAAVTNSDAGDAQLQDQIDEINDRVDDVEQGAQGQPGVPGENGISCWDLNANGVGDPDEDINGDGNYDASDCQGTDGEAGVDGTDGTNGTDGLSCWDLNGNGVGDPEEDINEDGNFDAEDCQGMIGPMGEPGEDLTGVIARARIDGLSGEIIGDNENMTSSLIPNMVGSYQIVVDVSNIPQAELEVLQSWYFPVFITIRAVSTEPGGGVYDTLLGYYEFPPYSADDPALDEVNGTLTFIVRIVDAGTGELARPQDFSLVVFEP